MNFIPNFHFDHPDTKLSNEWYWKAVGYHYYNTNNKSLLSGKNVKEIQSYADGSFSMIPYAKMFKSLDRQVKEAARNNPNGNIAINASTIGMELTQLPLIPTKLNSAISLVQKIPVEVLCTANDALAMQKKKDDMTFLQNKPLLEADMQDIADQMQIGRVDLGTTKNSSIEFGDSPFGLDLTDTDQRDLFSKLFYSLKVEAGLEKVLQYFYDIKNEEQRKLLMIRDTYLYGVCSGSVFTSSLTGLPESDYVFPDEITTQESDLPDYSDNTARFRSKYVSVLEMFNIFGSEICDEKTLDEIINGRDKFSKGYCMANSLDSVNAKNFDSFKVELVYIEVKSLDWVGVFSNPKSKVGTTTFTMDENKCTDKIWNQNTYCGWWLKNTKYFFGKKLLSYAHRTRGQESFQNFSTIIYKSQNKSAVELSIGENKKAQVADIKLQHAIVMSLPAGKVIDIKGMRNALAALTNEGTKYTMQDLLDLAFEKNRMIIDTQGFEGKNDGQMKPVYELEGGLKAEVNGYIQVIQQCAENISRFTGINEQLTGQSANPEGLVGMQKLMIQSSQNALNYVNKAIEAQYQKWFDIVGSLVQQAIEKGGKTKQAIVNYIGIDDVNILDGLNEIPLHNLTIKISITQREEERQQFRTQLNFLKSQGIITTTDEYLLNAIRNPKERFSLLAIKENQWQKKQDQIRKEQQENAEAIRQIANQGLVDAENAKTEGGIKKIYASGEVEAKKMQLLNSLNLQRDQFQFISKKDLQQDRAISQERKSIKQIDAKSEAEMTKPVAIV